MINDLCEMDLSPGTLKFPDKFIDLLDDIEFINAHYISLRMQIYI